MITLQYTDVYKDLWSQHVGCIQNKLRDLAKMQGFHLNEARFFLAVALWWKLKLNLFCCSRLCYTAAANHIQGSSSSDRLPPVESGDLYNLHIFCRAVSFKLLIAAVLSVFVNVSLYSWRSIRSACFCCWEERRSHFPIFFGAFDRLFVNPFLRASHLPCSHA